jgi:hypothetical protein
LNVTAFDETTLPVGVAANIGAALSPNNVAQVIVKVSAARAVPNVAEVYQCK